MIYVGKNKYPLGRMMMSHMIGDTLDELHAMADRIGVARKHFQDKPGKPHYDICQRNKVRALDLGAKLVDEREIIKILKATYAKGHTAERKVEDAQACN